MFQRVKDWAEWKWAVASAKLDRAWKGAEDWLVAHRQGFQGFVLGTLVAGAVIARMSCQGK